MVPFLERGFRGHQVPPCWTHRVTNLPLPLHLPADGLKGILQSSKAQGGSTRCWASCSLPPIPLTQGSGLKIFGPLAAAVGLESTGTEPQSICPVWGKTPTTDAVKPGREQQGSKLHATRGSGMAWSISSISEQPPIETTPCRTGCRKSTTTLPSKS